jgi:hypothetical protein
MRARGYAELTTTELSDELQFRSIRHAGWSDWLLRIAPPATIVSTFFVPSFNHIWAFRILMILSVAGSTRLDWLHGRATELRVTSSELVATGNIGKLFSTRKAVQASEVDWLGFNSVGQEWGLMLEGVETGVCLLIPGLNRKQAKTVADAILRRFPNIRPDFPR